MTWNERLESIAPDVRGLLMETGTANGGDTTVPTRRFFLPFWLRDHHRDCHGADIVAGLTLAAYAVPVSMAYLSLAGVPPRE